MIIDLIIDDYKAGHRLTVAINHESGFIDIKNYKIGKLYEIDDTEENRQKLLKAGITIYHKNKSSDNFIVMLDGIPAGITKYRYITNTQAHDLAKELSQETKNKDFEVMEYLGDSGNLPITRYKNGEVTHFYDPEIDEWIVAVGIHPQDKVMKNILPIYTREQWTKDGSLRCQPMQEIEEKIYDEMLNCLPPIFLKTTEPGFSRCFLMSEPCTDAKDSNGKLRAVYSGFGKKDGKYYYLGLLFTKDKGQKFNSDWDD